MPLVEFTIRNKKYNIACDVGEEPHIKKLAESLNVRVEAISASFGSASDSVILAITALMMEDEIKALKEGNKNETPQISTANNENYAKKINEELINALEPIAKYIESLANRIESV
jgi:cell division protein ZapA